ncbi:heme ABC transporter permease [Lichenibacterium minor]|uniref:Heme exporter protein C n=2 Tax=Lichenibacterium minor TaxID=2316528 RepID=A0A4Q2U3Q6_9HYPH|nr:heme ABC transporter permease [Lichenibacterium minor]
MNVAAFALEKVSSRRDTRHHDAKGRSMYALANPANFMRLSGRVLPWLAALSAATLAVGLYLGFASPADYQQGETAKIMFVHVPAAWIASLAYAAMAASALGTLVWRHPLAEAAQKAVVPLGAAFAFVCLVTGSLWGKPMWGTYWVWDARLTSMLVLFITYLGLLALWHTIEEPGRAARAASVLTLVGAINLPIVKFSVDWWNTLHQGSIFRMTGSTVDRSILVPLLVMAVGFTLLFATLHIASIRNEILRRRVRRLMLAAAADREPAARLAPSDGLATEAALS